MKILGKVYMHIINTFIWWNPQMASTRASIRDWNFLQGRTTPPCPCRPLPPRSWPCGRPGCFEAVYWPLSQLRTTWNNLKGCNLVSYEAHISFDQWSIRLAFSQPWVVITIRTFLGSEKCYLTSWLFVFWSWLKFFSSEKKMIWFVFAGFLPVRKAFSTVARVT